MSELPPPPSPSVDEMIAQMHTESFYRDMYEQTARQVKSLIKDNASLRDQIGLAEAMTAAARTDARRAREDSREWLRVAVRTASDVKVEWKQSEFAVHGSIVISADLMGSAGEEGIRLSCAAIADKIITERNARGLHTKKALTDNSGAQPGRKA